MQVTLGDSQPRQRISIGKFKLVILLYLILTISLYNKFFPVSASSRLPLLGLTFIAAIKMLPGLLKLPWNRQVLIPLEGFLLFYLLLEGFHFISGGKELIQIVSVFGVLLFVKYAKKFEKKYLIDALRWTCTLHLIYFYSLAFIQGMVGVSGNIKGTFLARFLPFLNSFMVNGIYPAGRGTFGLTGGTLAILALIRMKSQRITWTDVVQFLLGLAGVLVSDTRGVIIALFLVLAAILFPIPERIKIKVMHFLPIAILCLQPLFALGFGSILGSHTWSVMSREGIDVSDQARAVVWFTSLGLITSSARSFILGYGEEGASFALENIFQQRAGEMEVLNSAHNLSLQLVLNGGVLLFSFFLTLIVGHCRYLMKSSEKLRLLDLDSVSILSFVLLYGLSASIFSFSRVNEGLFLFIIALTTLSMQASSVRRSMSERQESILA